VSLVAEQPLVLLCGLMISHQAPDLIVLDEPTNLDLQHLEILTAALHAYHGTLLVVSHDEVFRKQLHLERAIRQA
jgi:ATPase subunit of ABC transporter with duplicated ATPase domains